MSFHNQYLPQVLQLRAPKSFVGVDALKGRKIFIVSKTIGSQSIGDNRAMQAMLQMNKIIIADLEKAFAG